MELAKIIAPFIRNRIVFKAKETIFAEGSETGHVFIIMKGRVRIVKNSLRGVMPLAALTAGHLLGETSFLDKAAKLRSATAIAETDVVLGVLNWEKIQEELSRLSPIQSEILSGLARRIRVTSTNAAAIV